MANELHKIVQLYLHFVNMEYTQLITVLICIVLGVSTFPTTGKLATESPRIMIVTPIPSNPTESTATETSSNDAAPPNFDNQPKTLTGENLSNAIGQAANEIVNLFIRADCDKWNANYGNMKVKLCFFIIISS